MMMFQQCLLISIVALVGASGCSQKSPNAGETKTMELAQPKSVVIPDKTSKLDDPKQEPSFSEFILGEGEDVDVSGYTLKLVGFTIESIAASPNSEYPSGSGVVLSFEINGKAFELSKLSKGYESQSTYWHNALMIDVVKFDDATNKVHLHLGRVKGEKVGSPERVRVQRRSDVVLPDGNRMRFDSHSHKSVSAGGPGSPLIVNVSYWKVQDLPQGLQSRDALSEKSYYLGPPAVRSTWTWHANHFELLSYEYSQYMELEVSELAIEPLAP